MELQSRARMNGMAISIRIESVFLEWAGRRGDQRPTTLALHRNAVKMKKRKSWTVHFDCETACRHCLSISYVRSPRKLTTDDPLFLTLGRAYQERQSESNTHPG